MRSSRQRALRSGRPPVAACRSATGRGPRARSAELVEVGDLELVLPERSAHGLRHVVHDAGADPEHACPGRSRPGTRASIGIAARSSSATPSISCWAGSCSAASASIRRAARARSRVDVMSADVTDARRGADDAANSTSAWWLTAPPPETRGWARRNHPRFGDRRRGCPARTIAACSSALPSFDLLLLPGDPGWDEARSAFNLLLDQHPAAIALPTDAQGVVAAVAYAREPGCASRRRRPATTRARSATSRTRCC